MAKKDRMVRVEWIDSCADSGWKNRQYAAKEACVSKCESVGFLFKETRSDVTVCQSISHTSGSVSEMMTIPMKCVTKIVRLKDE
jgi:hypothetical protein